VKKYRIVQGALEIVDPDFDTTTYINFDARRFVYSVLDFEGNQIQMGAHENLSDLESMTGLDTNDINMIEVVFLGGEK
jgi:hypothetical protein